jgi:hypothetical protein
MGRHSSELSLEKHLGVCGRRDVRVAEMRGRLVVLAKAKKCPFALPESWEGLPVEYHPLVTYRPRNGN